MLPDNRENVEYRIFEYWDDQEANYRYELRYKDKEISSKDWLSTPYSGDERWAMRQGEFYKCFVQLLDTEHSREYSKYTELLWQEANNV